MAENSTKYLNDPEAIYSLSFDRVARLIAGNHLPDDIRPVIVRLVHGNYSPPCQIDLNVNQWEYETHCFRTIEQTTAD